MRLCCDRLVTKDIFLIIESTGALIQGNSIAGICCDTCFQSFSSSAGCSHFSLHSCHLGVIIVGDVPLATLCLHLFDTVTCYDIIELFMKV